MEYSLKDIVESLYERKTTKSLGEKAQRMNKPEDPPRTNEKTSENNSENVIEKAKVQLDRTLKKEFTKAFPFEMHFYDIKGGFMIIGSNFKNSGPDEQLITSSSVYCYNIFNDCIVKLEKLESSKSLKFLAALEVHSFVLICYDNNDCVIFDYLNEKLIFEFRMNREIHNVISEQGLNKIFFTTETELWEYKLLEESPKAIELTNLEAPIRCIDKVKEVNIFLFLTETGQMKAYIHASGQIFEIQELTGIKVNRFMFMKESQILILETSDKKFQIWKVQVDYPHFKQRFTNNLDSEDCDQFFRGNEGNIKESKRDESEIHFEERMSLSENFQASILDQNETNGHLTKQPTKNVFQNNQSLNLKTSNIKVSEIEKINLRRSTYEIRTTLNDLEENYKPLASVPLILNMTYEFQLNFKPDLWDFCDSSNILFLTEKRESKDYLYCCFTHNDDCEDIAKLSEDKSITGMKICQSTQWMILTSSSNNLEGLNLSRTGLHPFGRHENIIDVFFDESTDTLYTCGSNNIKKWNMSTHKRIQSKTLFEDGLTRVMSYQFFVKTNVIFFTSNNLIGFINASTLENPNSYLLNNDPNFRNKKILMRINRETSSLILACQSSPDLYCWDFNNPGFYLQRIATDDKPISEFHISSKHRLIIVFFDESPDIHFYDAIEYQLKNRLQKFKALPLNFIFESEEHNHLYIGVKKLILIIDLISLEEIKQVPMKNTRAHQISREYLLINSENLASVKIWSLKTLSLVCKLDDFYFSDKQILIFKLLANRLFVTDKSHYLFQKFISNNTQNINKLIPFERSTSEPKNVLRSFENHLQKYIFSKNEIQINHFNVSPGYQAILHRPNNNSLVVIYEKNFKVWRIEPWRLISKNKIKEGNIVTFKLFTDDPNKLLIVIKQTKIYVFNIYELLPFKLCIDAWFEKKLKIGKFIVNTKTQFAYFCDSQYQKVYQFDFRKPKKSDYTDLYSFSHTIKKMLVSENQNWLFLVMVDPITIVYDLKNDVVLKTIEDNNSLRKIILLDSKNILVSMERDAYTIWEVSTLKLIGKFEFTNNKRTLHMQSPQSSLNDIISVKLLEKLSGQFLSIHNYSEINNLSFSEEIFLSNLLLNKSTPHQFLQSYRQTKHIYDSSLVLKKYFNIYLLAVMSDNEKTFEILFEEDKEPFEFYNGQINPLQLLMAKKDNEKLKHVMNFMDKKRVHLPIDNKLFASFLKKQENFIFDYLAKACTIIELYENNEEDIVFDHNMIRSITIINHSWPVYTQATDKKLIESQKNSIPGKVSNWFRGLPCQKGVVIYKLNIEWDFHPYTQTSLDFLLAYYHSTSDDFILSPYRHIISAKWKSLYLFFGLQALINWAHIILYCFFLLDTKVFSYFIADLFLLFIIFIYEIFSCVANIDHYKKDQWNYIDIINLVLCLLFLFWNYGSDTPVYKIHWVLLILQNLSVVLVTIRGYSFFRFMPRFSHITTMSGSMIKYSMTIIILISYCILCLSVVLATTSLSYTPLPNNNESHSYISNLGIMYDLLFGNIPSEWPKTEDSIIIYIITIVISSVILPIFFMNFLIAQLSSAYNASEQRQLIISLKEISFLIYEWELLIGFVKKKIFGHEINKKEESVFLVVDKNRLLPFEKSTFDDALAQKMDGILANQMKQMRVIDDFIESFNSKFK